MASTHKAFFDSSIIKHSFDIFEYSQTEDITKLYPLIDEIHFYWSEKHLIFYKFEGIILEQKVSLTINDELLRKSYMWEVDDIFTFKINDKSIVINDNLIQEACSK